MLIKILIAFSLSFLGPGAFASSCQGLSKSKCESEKKCYWTSGKKMKAHCRTKPGKGKTASKLNKKKAKGKIKSKKKKSKKSIL